MQRGDLAAETAGFGALDRRDGGRGGGLFSPCREERRHDAELATDDGRRTALLIHCSTALRLHCSLWLGVTVP